MQWQFQPLGRRVGVPPGIVDRQDGVVPEVMLPARVLLALEVHVAQIGPQLLVALEVCPVAGRIGDAHVDVEDRLQPAEGAELGRDGLARQRIDDRLSAPPAFRLKDRCQLGSEVAEGLALRKRLLKRAPDVVEDVVAGRLGDGEHFRVEFLPDHSSCELVRAGKFAYVAPWWRPGDAKVANSIRPTQQVHERKEENGG